MKSNLFLLSFFAFGVRGLGFLNGFIVSLRPLSVLLTRSDFKSVESRIHGKFLVVSAAVSGLVDWIWT